MQGNKRAWLAEPLVAERSVRDTRTARIALLLVWLTLAAWLTWTHVPWRDEARAWSLMLMGRSWPDMFRAVHGEGHPYLWYIILRAGWDLFGVKQVLPIAGFLLGVAATSLLVLRAPFRLGVIAVIIFSWWLGFEYVAVARNYGMAALLMFVIAWQWQHIRDRLWLGVLIALLCNTNVPSVFLAGALMLYRTLELWSEQSPRRSAEWGRWLGNAVLSLLGVLLCFLAVYPPVNDGAASTQAQALTGINLLAALITSLRSFMVFGFGDLSMVTQIYLWGCLLMFVRRLPALAAAAAALVALKLFFFFIYPGYYRHAALFLAFMVSLAWIEADKRRAASVAAEPGVAPTLADQGAVARIGTWLFLILLAAQCTPYLIDSVIGTARGIPYSNAAAVAQILERPEYRGSVFMVDPDTHGEAVVYQTGRPYWLIRQDRLGTLTPLTVWNRPPLTYDRLVAKAEELRQRTGRPVLILLTLDLDRQQTGRKRMIYDDNDTELTPATVAFFRAHTRRIARLRQAMTDERYDVYVYPR